VVHPPGASGVRALLEARRCIQLDPLDRIGTNADLVAMARVDGLRRDEVYTHLLPGHAFEHFAKERCLLPAYAFPYYREQTPHMAWWRHGERVKRLASFPGDVVEEVLEEVRQRGPVTSGALEDRGSAEALDWNGWKGAGKVNTLALEVLWTDCRVVVCGRSGRAKLYDLPERALPEVAAARTELPFEEWALGERVEAAGLLATASGPHWSMLDPVRRSDLPRQLVDQGRLALVRVDGSRRTYLAPTDLSDRRFPDDDGRMRILGPLDPLLWDRKLVSQVFGFDYVWEVYKPKAQRRWGYYVCPLLHRGHLVGRLEAHVDAGRVVVDRLWEEEGQDFDPGAFAEAVERHQDGM